MVSDKQAREINALVELLLNHPDGMDAVLREIAQAEMNKRRDRIARNNAKYQQLLTQMTNKQANVVSMRDSQGYKVNQVVYNKRRPEGNVAVMLVKDAVFDVDSGKVKQKIIVVYSDGTQDETFQRSIQMRSTL